MCFRKNVSYEILRAVADRDEAILKTITATAFTPKKIIDHEKLAKKIGISKDELNNNLNQMKKEGLLLLDSDADRGEPERYVDGITSEGRVLLDRLENNRWQNRIRDWFWGVIGAVVLAVVLKWLEL